MTLFVVFQRALVPAMSDGNRNLEGFRTGECSPPARGFTPDAVPTRRKEKEGKQMRTQN